MDQRLSAARMRANMGGWEQERFYAQYRLGTLLCEHVSFLQGAKELIGASVTAATSAASAGPLSSASVGSARAMAHVSWQSLN